MSKLQIIATLFIFFTATLTGFTNELHVTPKDTLYVGIDVNQTSNQAYMPIFQDFEKLTGIKIKRYPFKDMKSLDDPNSWLTKSGKILDIVNGHASNRLQEYFIDGKVSSITTVWESENLQNKFKKSQEHVKYNDEILGLPISLSGWFILYREKSNLINRTIHDFQDLIATCNELKKQDIIPFYLSTKSPYSVMVWFEYIVLRTYGLEFLKELTKGEISYLDPRLNNVMSHWQQLIHAGCYSNKFGPLTIREVFPYFYRKKVAMMLVSPGILSLATENVFNDINLISFPKINEIPRVESVPINLFIVNKQSQKQDAINLFIKYLARTETQLFIANIKHHLPANDVARDVAAYDKIVIKERKLIESADARSVFIDRMLPAKFERESRPVFIHFVKTGDINYFQQTMEQLRLDNY